MMKDNDIIMGITPECKNTHVSSQQQYQSESFISRYLPEHKSENNNAYSVQYVGNECRCEDVARSRERRKMAHSERTCCCQYSWGKGPGISRLPFIRGRCFPGMPAKPLPLRCLSSNSCSFTYPFMIVSLLFLSNVKRLVKSTARFVLYAPLSHMTPHLAFRHPNGTHYRRGQKFISRSDSTYQGPPRLHSKRKISKLHKKSTLKMHSHRIIANQAKRKTPMAEGSRTKLRLRVFLYIVLALFPNASTSYELKPTTTVSRVTLAGQKAQLPCELPLPADRPTLILWYKDQSTKPFYSFDAREAASGRHKIHDNSDLATRSKFALDKDFPNVKNGRIGYLEVEGVILADAGNYTCRVDFMTSQTMMALLKLAVHEEIRGLEVFDMDGGIVSKVVGPHEQFKRVMLSCRAYGGYPPPVVQWMSGDMILKSSTDQAYNLEPEVSLPGGMGSQPLPMVSVMLHLAGLRREDNGREIKCIAFNTNLTQPRSRVLTIQVYLPPLEVKVEGLEKPMRAGIESMLLCRTTGSRPPATLSWKLEGSSALTPLPAQSSLDQNTTLRRGRLLPTTDDHGRTLTCAATNPKVPEYKLAVSHTLEVHFPPEVEAKLAPALDPSNIKEGDDVYFECSVKANPPESKVIWLHEGKQLHTDLQLGVLAQGKNLVLQKVSRHAMGNYRCRVTNSIDTVTSAPTSLNVMFVPECSDNTNATVSVTPTEEVKLNCRVDSNPEEVRFIWKVNSTRGEKEIGPSRYTSQGRNSILVYRPSEYAVTNDQYGVVSCQGINKLGIQKIPCFFIISPAGPPEELESCVLKNQSATSLAVVCVPGHDGGLEQHFIATIQDAENAEIVANLSSKEPQFSVGGLAPGRDYLVMVKATNSKGSSDPYVLEGFALKVHEIKINNSSSDESSPLLAVFVGVLSIFIVLFIAIAFINRARGRRRREQSAQEMASKLSTTEGTTPVSPPEMAASLEGRAEDDPKTVEVEAPAALPPQTLLTPEVQPQALQDPGSLASHTYIAGGPAGHTGSLPRPQLHSRPQPLHSVDLPHITSSNHKYYTLKINCTRQNNESFV
ncbi:roundabout homolog 3-like isoform X1 [Macrobrachium nipponense]|uniref:roundabout homolog 3-like isoform X1 n=1 Tax=Macrobrachium nipponense TaxID=159736 RepID=UPI0030C89E79